MLVDFHRDVECGAERRLVPPRKEAPRVHRLHVRGEHAFLDQALAVALPVGDLVQAVRMLEDAAGVFDVEPVAARGDAPRRRRQRDRLALAVEFRRERRRVEPRAAELELEGIELDGRDRPRDLDLDLRAAVEALGGSIRHDAQRIVLRHDVLRQLAGRGLEGEARLGYGRAGCQDRGQEERAPHTPRYLCCTSRLAVSSAEPPLQTTRPFSST
jgi:hypothetical protein